MIGIDTNILVRAFMEDDLDQAQKAQKLMGCTAQESRLFISSYALLDFVWELRKTKKFSRLEIYEAIITLTDSPGITIGQREVVLSACEKYLKGKADFADYMILSEGEQHGAKELKTFDRAVLAEVHNASIPI